MDVISVYDLINKDIRGKVICFPTDTVYGVGALIDDIEAIKKIYNLKNRDYSKPLAILTGTKDIDRYVMNISKDAKQLMDKYWPGALTLVFKKTNLIPDIVTSNLNTVGLRMPNSSIALMLLEKFGLLATTSINISGDRPLNNKEDIIKQFGNDIDYLVMETQTSSNVSSSIIDVTEKNIKVIRQGDIII